MIAFLLTLAWMALLSVTALLLLSKAFFLAPFRAGWGMLVANAVYETLERKVKVDREKVDWGLWLLLTIGAAIIGGPWFGVLWAIGCGAALVGALLVERRWLSDSFATQMESMRGRVPLPLPRLIVSIRGAALLRAASGYDLGDWPQGMKQSFEILVLNPGLVRPQLPLSIAIESDTHAVEVQRDGELATCPEPGEVRRQKFSLRATRAGGGGFVHIKVSHGDRSWSRTLKLRSIVPIDPGRAITAQIRRWPYGCRAGFAWRGDNDLYDPATFQSAQGLRLALGLAARYRMPTTIMLSPRLSLEEEQHREFCERYGWNRHSEEVPSFVRFFAEEVDMTNEQEFPTRADKPFAAEIGNHMYLHYGTHAAADPGNEWRSHTKIGGGNYPWLEKHPCSSFEEQRDNILACTASTKRHLGVTTTCFGIPSDVWDADTSRAAEAAGIEVANDTDTRKIDLLLLYPKERHPAGTQTLAELTRRVPRDPLNAPQVAMLKFWVGFARRTGRAVVFLAHHHLVMYESNRCFNLTSELLRHVLADTEGDVHAATITALGRYWRDVLSERTRKVAVEVTGLEVIVRNGTSRAFTGLPIELDLGGGRSTMVLVDLPANGSATISIDGEGREGGAP